MAKSIWLIGQPMTRVEKKLLRKLMPHPNKGRALYQWKAENSRISSSFNVAVRTGRVTANDLNVEQPPTKLRKPGQLKRELQATLKRQNRRLSKSNPDLLSALYVDS